MGTEQILAYKELADNKISPKNDDLFLFVDGGSKGTWVTSGERTFTGTAALQAADIKIFPTLTNDKVNIVSTAKNSPFVVEVYNSLGQLMLQTTTQTPNTSLSLAALPKGMYWIRLQRDKELMYQAVVKE